MRVAILQPSYLPWMGYFEQMHFADTFVFLNDVQYTKNDWRNRNRIKTPRGAAWITVPVKRLSSKQRISETEIDHRRDWPADHLNLLAENYGDAEFFGDVLPLIKPHLLERYRRLEDLTVETTLAIMRYLGWDRRIVKSSEIPDLPADKNRRLVEICRSLKATEFYEGSSGRDYLDVPLFEREGIRVVFQDFRHPEYRQFHPPFVPYLSVLDLLFHRGPAAREVIVSGHA